MSDDSLQIFADEAEDLLSVAEQALLNLDDLNNEVDTLDGVNDLFRTFHTIKGGAGLFGLDAIVEFTHIVESLLVKIREGAIKIDEEMVSLFLSSRDHLEQLVENALSGAESLDEALKAKDEVLASKVSAYLGDSSTDNKAAQVEINTDDRKPNELNQAGVENEHWHISLRFGLNTLRNGMDPISFISYLNKLGELGHVMLVEEGIPLWDKFDPESCYLGFELTLKAPDSSKESIEEVFEFVQDDCKICILPPFSHIDAYVKMIEALPEDDLRIGDMLVACGALTEREKENVLNTQDSLSDEVTAAGYLVEVPPLGKIAVGQHVVQQAVVDAAINKQSNLKQKQDSAQQTIRVNALKLENLVNLVGELVIGSANSELNARRFSDPELNEAMENLLHLVEEVRDTALGLRMVQIGETFNRYKRVVREVSRDTGKNIELKISGAETELDKTLIEKIGDPLMHLVRNAIDHGIETPEARLAVGKPAKGTVNLDAFHDSGSVVIQIKDDGGGLSKQKILNKALEKGLIQDEQSLTEQEIFMLIFQAGFSTAESVSNLSGRGVGMDVVRKNIEALRGQIDIQSEEGKGSTFSIRLPLTLAIIDGFQVRVGEVQYIVPLDMIDECIELDHSLRGKDESANYINLRGEILPFMHLTDMFGTHSHINMTALDKTALAEQKKHRDNIVVVRFAGKKAGFVVDELLGEHQTVIKPLGCVFQNLKGISGTTILGSGEVAMIIDIPEMVKRVVSAGNNTGNYNDTSSKAIH
ncbi:MAG: two-component system chemotaxis sensor kinase CheA [Oleiphilaceae bacterium]|jgi:two-component system chemotaxis sensor kinase CheA